MSHDTPDDIVDLQFALRGQALPRDYADALWRELRAILPWLEAEPLAAVHPLGGLSSGSGTWYLSHRSRLTLRLARGQVAAAAALVGARLDLGGAPLEIGAATVRELRQMPVLHAKFVAIAAAAQPPVAEADFLAACRADLAARGMTPQLVCGMAQRADTSAGLLSGFSLMLFGLDAAQNMRLQREGLGGGRKHGCGIFVPHKSIAAVGTLE